MRLTNTVGAILAIGVLGFAACGGDDASPDARESPADAGPDGGGSDAMLPVGACGSAAACGSISVQEIEIAGVPQLGQGPQVSITFNDDSYKGATIAGPLIGGCSATEYSPTELAAEPGLDEGTIQVTHVPANDAEPMVFGPCNFVTGAGYLCIKGGSPSATVAITVGNPIPEGTALVTPVTGGTVAANDVGAYMQTGGFANAGNNGAGPIVQFVPANAFGPGSPPADSVVVAGIGEASEVAAAANYTVISGQGPIPGAEDPGFLGDDDGLTIALTKGGAMDFDDFTATFAAGADMGIGDDFTLNTASASAIANIPGDGSTFTISCSGAGGDCGIATGAILTISASDGSLADVSPFSLPPPTAKQTEVTCTTLAANGDLTISPEISALLMANSPTRARTTYLRSNLISEAGGQINVIAGHGIAGFTNFGGE
jgi:hypothetical protein